MFYRRWFVCLFVCLSVTTITKKIVDGFVPNFIGRFLGESRFTFVNYTHCLKTRTVTVYSATVGPKCEERCRRVKSSAISEIIIRWLLDYLGLKKMADGGVDK